MSSEEFTRGERMAYRRRKYRIRQSDVAIEGKMGVNTIVDLENNRDYDCAEAALERLIERKLEAQKLAAVKTATEQELAPA